MFVVSDIYNLKIIINLLKTKQASHTEQITHTYVTNITNLKVYIDGNLAITSSMPQDNPSNINKRICHLQAQTVCRAPTLTAFIKINRTFLSISTVNAALTLNSPTTALHVMKQLRIHRHSNKKHTGKSHILWYTNLTNKLLYLKKIH